MDSSEVSSPPISLEEASPDVLSCESLRPLLTDALIFAFMYLTAWLYDQTANMGRPGMGYPGYVVLAIVTGALMVWRSSPIRRGLCFTVLLLALLRMHSEWAEFDRFAARSYQIHLQSLRDQLDGLR